jgi:hypothetical protein
MAAVQAPLKSQVSRLTDTAWTEEKGVMFAAAAKSEQHAASRPERQKKH